MIPRTRNLIVAAVLSVAAAGFLAAAGRAANESPSAQSLQAEAVPVWLPYLANRPPEPTRSACVMAAEQARTPADALRRPAAVAADRHPRVLEPRVIEPEPASGRMFTSVAPEPPDPDALVQMVANPQGGMWVATDHGAFRLAADAEDPSSYAVVAHFTVADGLPDNRIEDVAVVGPHAWAATASGLARQRPDGQWSAMSEPNAPTGHVRAVESDGSGGLWARDENGVYHRGADGSWRAFDAPMDPEALHGALAADAAGNAWFTHDQHIVRLGTDGSRQRWDTAYLDLGPLAPPRLGIAVAPDGAVWVIPNRVSSRAVVIEADGTLRVEPPDGSGLPVPTAVAVTADGTAWMTGSSPGLVRFREGVWDWIDPAEAMGLDPFSLELPARPAVDANGDLWFSGRGGFVRRDGSTAETDAFDFTFRPAAHRQLQSGPLVPDPTGGMWIGTTFVHPDGTVEPRPGPGPHWSGITAMHVFEDGNVWYAGFGLTHLAPDGRLDYVGPSEGLPTGSISSITADAAGRLWIGTGQGAAWRGTAGEWHTLGTSEGLPYPGVQGVLPAADGGMWLLTRAVDYPPDPARSAVVYRAAPGDVRTIPAVTVAMESAGAVDPENHLWLAGPADPENPSRESGSRLVEIAPDGADGHATVSEVELAPEVRWIRDIAVSPSGAVWLLGDGAVHRLDAGVWATIDLPEPISGSAWDYQALALRDGAAVTASRDMLVTVSPDPESGGLSIATRPIVLPMGVVFSALEIGFDDAGRVWLATQDDILREPDQGDAPGSVWPNFDTAGIPGLNILDGAVDVDGTAVFADLPGLSLYREEWLAWRTGHGVMGGVRAVEMGPDDSLWLVYGGNQLSDLARQDAQGQWAQFERPEGVRSIGDLALHPSLPRHIWLAHLAGLSLARVDADGLSAAQTYGDLPTHAVDLDPDGTAWFTTAEGIGCVAPSGRGFLFTPAEGPRGFWSLARDATGNRWFAREPSCCVDLHRELSPVDPGQSPILELTADGDWRAYGPANGLPGRHVADMDVAAGGQLWISTGDGGTVVGSPPK